MDPQQRLLLEVAWEALEDAGQAPDAPGRHRDRRVRRASATSDYARLLARPGRCDAVDAYFGTGNAHSVAAGRLSYVLGLQRPERGGRHGLLVVAGRGPPGVPEPAQPASAALALAGGVNLDPVAGAHRRLLPGAACWRPTAAARRSTPRPTATSAARAAAWSCSSGCRDALADGDRVLAVIRGSAVNQDGRSSGLTAPTARRRRRVIRAGAGRGAASTPRGCRLRRGARHRHAARRSDRGAARSAPCSAERPPGGPAAAASAR